MNCHKQQHFQTAYVQIWMHGIQQHHTENMKHNWISTMLNYDNSMWMHITNANLNVPTKTDATATRTNCLNRLANRSFSRLRNCNLNSQFLVLNVLVPWVDHVPKLMFLLVHHTSTLPYFGIIVAVFGILCFYSCMMIPLIVFFIGSCVRLSSFLIRGTYYFVLHITTTGDRIKGIWDRRHFWGNAWMTMNCQCYYLPYPVNLSKVRTTQTPGGFWPRLSIY